MADRVSGISGSGGGSDGGRSGHDVGARQGEAAATADAAPTAAVADHLQRYVGNLLLALAEAEGRAELAERRLRSRLVELTWPAVAAGFAGGFAAVMTVRWAGL